MARGIDHVVHAVRDLNAAASLYRRLGFQVSARNRHAPAWGTQNHIVQLPGTFIELLTVAEPGGIAPHGPRFFSFGAHNRDALARGEGLSMLVLESSDAQADAREFSEAGIGGFDVFDFEREGQRPDGSAIKVAFSLAFARDPRASEIGFFTCQHRFPENFWNSAFQVHPNTAHAVAGIASVSANPVDHRNFLAALTGERPVLTTSGRLVAGAARGDIHVMSPMAFTRDFGVAAPNTTRSAQLAALRFSVHDLDTAASAFKVAGVPVIEQPGRLVIGRETAMGATLVFETLRNGQPLR